ncbi:MAG: hypothetical protein IJ565_05845 [Bacilli bacterium]|nr:hypothetical protein [Bacilli bacterium]
MNKAKKNVVIVGFTGVEKDLVPIPSLSLEYYESQKVHYVNKINEASVYQGYMIIINNKDNKSPMELDKKYRKIFNKFVRVVIYNKSYRNDCFENKWFKIETIGEDDLHCDLSYGYGVNWDEYKMEVESEKKPIKFNKNKKEKLDILYEYTKQYKTRKTSDIVKDLHMNERTIQRYMHDLNTLYHNVGYDYLINEWYFSK